MPILRPQIADLRGPDRPQNAESERVFNKRMRIAPSRRAGNREHGPPGRPLQNCEAIQASGNRAVALEAPPEYRMHSHFQDAGCL